ncbi:hypothetical protein FACS189479_06940 [Spirochaetia bacterium]|nr:hypothetical protein FACS189479_06940 [Spirochaetia bacterium]
MKKILLDTCVINKLIDDKFVKNESFEYLKSKIDTKEIQVIAIPANIVEVSLCVDHAKRKALSNVLNELIEGRNILCSWEAYLVLFLFQSINAQINGVLINEIELLREANVYSQLMIGLLGQMCFFEDYKIGFYDSVVREKLITKYYQARFISDPEVYLNLYLKQLNGKLDASEIENDAALDTIKIEELENKIEEKYLKRKKIRNVKEFSKHKVDFINYFAKHEFADILIAFFQYKETIERSLNLKTLVNNWDKPLFGMTAKPLADEIGRIASNEKEVPSFDFYKLVLSFLTKRIPNDCMFPVNHIYNIYLNELENILNDSKEPSRGSALDLDYYPGCLLCDYFLTDDKNLYENIKRVLKKTGNDENKVQSFSKDWKKYI